MRVQKVTSLILTICFALALTAGCALRSPVTPVANPQPPTPPVVVTPGASESATRRQIAINLDRGQLTIGSLITIKRDLRTQGIINHDQELAITEVLDEANNAIREALKLMETNPSFDLSSTGKIAGLVSQVFAAATRLSASRLPPAIEEALRRIADIAGKTQRLFD